MSRSSLLVGIPVGNMKAGNLGLITWWGLFFKTTGKVEGSIKSGEIDTEDTVMSSLGVSVGNLVFIMFIAELLEEMGLITWWGLFTKTTGKVEGSVTGKSGEIDTEDNRLLSYRRLQHQHCFSSKHNSIPANSSADVTQHER
jgi:hypothetical protein